MSNISSKFQNAKVGAYFYESVDGRNKEPRLLLFKGLTHGAGVAYRDEAIFEVVGTGERLFVDADDRYGYYPPLSGNNLMKMKRRQRDLRAELARYDHLLKVVDAKIDDIIRPLKADVDAFKQK